MGMHERNTAIKGFNTEKNAALVTIEDLMGNKDYWKAVERMPVEAEDVLVVIRRHQKTLKAMQFDPSRPDQVRAHLAAMDLALSQLTKNEPVQLSSRLRDVLTELPKVFTSKELLEGFKQHFNLESDEQAMGLMALWDARAKSEGMPLDKYLQKKVAGIVPGEGAVLREVALYQRTDEGGMFGRIREQISGLYDYASSKVSNALRKVELWQLNEQEAEIIKSRTGFDIKDYRHVIDSYAINHILKQHGDVKAEAKRGQIAITKDDISLIPDIVGSPDAIENAGKSDLGKDMILYKKTINGLIYYFEEVRTGKKELAALSMRKYRATNDMPPESKTSSDTSETLRPVDQLPDSNIPPSAGDGKDILYQYDYFQRHQAESRGEAVTKGAVQFLEDGRAIIHAFKSADLSTAIHESAHIWRRDLEGQDQVYAPDV